MTTLVPLPQISKLVAAMVSGAGTGFPPIDTWAKNGERASWYSRGAVAIRSIAEMSLTIDRRKGLRLWFPDYFCNASTVPARNAGFELCFYPIKEDLQPDWERCRQIAEERPPALFMLVHYFGHLSDSAPAREFCDEFDALLVEDGAHVLEPYDGIGVNCDFSFYSPHKLLPVPDGAVLLANTPRAKETLLDNREEVSGKFASTGVWVAKRVVQRIMLDALLERRLYQRHPAFDADLMPGKPEPGCEMSVLSRRLLKNLKPRITDVATRRQANARAWRSAFDGAKIPLRPFFETHGAEGSAPYRFVLRAPDTDTARTWYEQLWRSGVPVETWPDLPPELAAHESLHEMALKLRRTLLFLPTHQSFQAERFVRRVKSL